MTPEARTDQVLAQDVGDEVVVYDEQTHQAHHLNRTASLVWRLANGRRSVGEMANVLHKVLDVPDDEDFVRLGLAELDKAGLLAHPLPAAGQPISRRELFGVAAALLPLVVSIVAPTPAMAGTLNCATQPDHYSGTATLSGSCGSQMASSGSLLFSCSNVSNTFTLRIYDDTNNRQNITYTGTLSGNAFSGSNANGTVSGVITGGTITVTEIIGSCVYTWSGKV
jgi:hypothetical protein